jgi:hypothetical protein
MVFNNGQGRPAGAYSTVDVFTPPVNTAGAYTISGTAAFGPAALSWQYKAATPTDFYGQNISSAQRLSSGNTIICEGPSGKFFEVDNAGNTVWSYVNPVVQSGPVAQGTTPALNAVFRCTQYSATFPGFAGKTLTAGAPIEQNPLPYNCIMGSTVGVQPINGNESANVINPFTDEIVIRTTTDITDATISLTTITGAVCKTWHMTALPSGITRSFPIDAGMPPGLYLLQLSGKGFHQTLKLTH